MGAVQVNSDEFIEKLEKTKSKLWEFDKKIFRFLLALSGSFISYGIMLWIYLYVYDVYGWHRTLIAIGVGVIAFSLRGKVKNA